jgi:hypothetical protein
MDPSRKASSASIQGIWRSPERTNADFGRCIEWMTASTRPVGEGCGRSCLTSQGAPGRHSSSRGGAPASLLPSERIRVGHGLWRIILSKLRGRVPGAVIGKLGALWRSVPRAEAALIRALPRPKRDRADGLVDDGGARQGGRVCGCGCGREAPPAIDVKWKGKGAEIWREGGVEARMWAAQWIMAALCLRARN